VRERGIDRESKSCASAAPRRTSRPWWRSEAARSARPSRAAPAASSARCSASSGCA